MTKRDTGRARGNLIVIAAGLDLAGLDIDLNGLWRLQLKSILRCDRRLFKNMLRSRFKKFGLRMSQRGARCRHDVTEPHSFVTEPWNPSCGVAPAKFNRSFFNFS